VPIPFDFDFKRPDYLKVFDWRLERLNRIRRDPEMLVDLKAYYREDIAQFIIDWGSTSDPRNAERNLPTVIPFLLFKRQEEWIKWVIGCWRNQRAALTDKSREMGVSWLSVALASSMAVLMDRVEIGFGSRKEEYVDKRGDPKSILYKSRQYISLLPVEFRAGFDARKNSPHMRILIPDTGSVISGEAGNNIGRGDRKSIYFLDEAAHILQPEEVEKSLASTTNCPVYISTPNGMNNPFARKRHGGKIEVFTMHWREDPRKDDAWYKRACERIDDPVVIAQELDLDYNASVEGVVIPSAWVQAAVDAHIALCIEPTGIRRLGLDVADEGSDKNGAVGRHGILIELVDLWSGVDSDIYRTVMRAFEICDAEGYHNVRYDADGLGAGVRGDARVENQRRKVRSIKEISFTAHRGSAAVVNPTEEVFERDLNDSVKGRTNEDYFENFKAQSWWALRKRFLKTFRAVRKGMPFHPDEIISISSTIDNYQKLVNELSQAVYTLSKNGKLMIEKTPDGGRSPNLADAAVIAFAPEAVRRSIFV
jgi:phage terminase large subunit